MREKQDQVVKIVMADPAVQAVGSFFGGGFGSAMNNARMFISLKPKGHGKDEREDDPLTIMGRLRGKLSKIPGGICTSGPARTSASVAALKAAYQYALTIKTLTTQLWAPKLVKNCAVSANQGRHQRPAISRLAGNGRDRS